MALTHDIVGGLTYVNPDVPGVLYTTTTNFISTLPIGSGVDTGSYNFAGNGVGNAVALVCFALYMCRKLISTDGSSGR